MPYYQLDTPHVFSELSATTKLPFAQSLQFSSGGRGKMIRPAVFLGCLLLTPSCGATDSHQYTVGFANSGRRPVLGQRQNSVAVATRWKQQHSVIFDLRGGDYASSLLGHQNQVDSFLNAIDLFGTGIFAFSGAVTAGRKGMDILGMWIISIVTSLGGGTLRDILLDTGTVFWMEQAIYVQISSITVRKYTRVTSHRRFCLFYHRKR